MAVRREASKRREAARGRLVASLGKIRGDVEALEIVLALIELLARRERLKKRKRR